MRERAAEPGRKFLNHFSRSPRLRTGCLLGAEVSTLRVVMAMSLAAARARFA
jgi:hypothetical protein